MPLASQPTIHELVPLARIERATYTVGTCRSGPLSYKGVNGDPGRIRTRAYMSEGRSFPLCPLSYGTIEFAAASCHWTKADALAGTVSLRESNPCFRLDIKGRSTQLSYGTNGDQPVIGDDRTRTGDLPYMEASRGIEPLCAGLQPTA